MAGEFEGKVVVVTGGSRGIGRAIAKAFAAEGAQTVLAAASAANLAGGAKAVAAAGGPAPLTVVADLRTLPACEQLFAAVDAEFKRCDVLVNNAGATKGGKFADLPDEAWQDGFALKFFATVRLTKLFWPLLTASHGSIINIIGGAARTPGPDFLIGGAVNAAVANFAKGLTAMGNRDDVNVNVIHPGKPTPTASASCTSSSPRRRARRWSRSTPRRWPRAGCAVSASRRTSPRLRYFWRARRAVTSKAPPLPSMAAARRDITSAVFSRYRLPAAAASSRLPACGRRRARSESRWAFARADDRA